MPVPEDVERDVLARAYAWRHDQATAGASAAFALATAILTPLLAAVFNNKAHVEGWHLVLFVGGTALAATGGALFRLHARQVQRRYLRAVLVHDPEVPLTWP